jgi:molecular chaperone DnaK
MIEEMGEKVSDTDKADIQAEIAKLKSVSESMHAETMNESEITTLKSAIETYTKAMNEFAQKIYQAAGPTGGEQGEPSDYGPQHDENTFDGDYTEQ